MGILAARPGLVRATLIVRQCLTAGALTLAVGVGALSVYAGDATPPRAEPFGLSGQDVPEAFERHRCTTTGFGTDVTPEEAVVRFADGRTKVVPFTRGWASFTGDKPGELVAVCLGRTRD